MSVREPGPLSRANSAYLVVDHFSRGWRLIKLKKKVEGIPTGCQSRPTDPEAGVASTRWSGGAGRSLTMARERERGMCGGRGGGGVLGFRV